MKGPNPFAPWEDDPSAMSGRKDESRIFNGFASAVAARQGRLVALIGGPGEGKSMLLRSFKSEGERLGMLCPLVMAERGETEKSLVDKLCQEISYSAGPRKGPAAASHDGLEKALSAAERADKSGFGVVILIDDLDRMRKAGVFLARLEKAAKAGWGRRRIGFVVGMTADLGQGDGVERMRLRPFEEHEARELVEKALKKGPAKMGDECLSSIIADSGGNPRLIKSVCRHIYDKLRDNEKVITKGHYLGYMQHIMSMLSREWFGRMYQETPAAERMILHELAGEEGGMHVSDIAKKIGKPLGPVTALTKRLLDSGQIVRVDRGKYRVFAKLYARYVRERG